ncbi:hypothetical protein MHYP_G00077830 [Metynnis hypsauchen]
MTEGGDTEIHNFRKQKEQRAEGPKRNHSAARNVKVQNGVRQWKMGNACFCDFAQFIDKGALACGQQQLLCAFHSALTRQEDNNSSNLLLSGNTGQTQVSLYICADQTDGLPALRRACLPEDFP